MNPFVSAIITLIATNMAMAYPTYSNSDPSVPDVEGPGLTEAEMFPIKLAIWAVIILITCGIGGLVCMCSDDIDTMKPVETAKKEELKQVQKSVAKALKKVLAKNGMVNNKKIKKYHSRCKYGAVGQTV